MREDELRPRGGPAGSSAPVVTRSRVVLEIACELVAEGPWPRQAQVRLRQQGGTSWERCLFGSDAPGAIEEVASGAVDLAIANPSAPVEVAYRGKGPFERPLPLRTISVIPSADMFLFAVAERTGLTSLAEIGEKRYPLRISMRGQPDHAIYFLANTVLGALGFTLDDIASWGGAVTHHRFPPDVAAVGRGEIDAIFDEAAYNWGNRALEGGMRVLPVEEPLLGTVEDMGFRRAVMSAAEFPALRGEITTLDFSGWPIYTREDVSAEFIRSCCAALEARKHSIPWQEPGPLPLERMCRDARDTPLPAPLHPAAEAYWRERGYL
ncbi:MAG: hypothetical protein HW416_3317 [Chloroflexi bacterium]|nr:hypothetical protein [Chloroflexota bacterium]